MAKELSITSQWAVDHNYRIHPALKQAIDNARPLIAKGLWALAVAEAFDAGTRMMTVETWADER